MEQKTAHKQKKKTVKEKTQKSITPSADQTTDNTTTVAVKETPKKSVITGKNHPAKRGSKFRKILSILALPIWAGIVIFACQYIVTFGLYFILGKETLTTPLWISICDALIYALSLFLIIWLPIKFKKWRTSREELGIKGLPTWADIGLAPIGLIVYLLLATLLVSFFSCFPFFDAEQAQELGFKLLTNGFDRILAFIALCIIAPVAEELIFRGWLYGKLRAKIPGKAMSLILSVLITSILFGIMHGQWNVGVNVFAMSIVLCGLREITGTIYSGILLHIIKNTIAFVLVYIIGGF